MESPGCDGAEQEAHGGAGVGLEVAAVFHALGDQNRMAEGRDRLHDQLGGLARVDRVELAGLDPVAQNELGHVAQRVHDMVLAAIEHSWETIRTHKEVMHGVTELILRDGIEAGEFEPVDPRETSRLMMISLVHFCHPVLVAQYLQDQGDIEADASATVRFLLRAITPRS